MPRSKRVARTGRSIAKSAALVPVAGRDSAPTARVTRTALPTGVPLAKEERRARRRKRRRGRACDQPVPLPALLLPGGFCRAPPRGRDGRAAPVRLRGARLARPAGALRVPALGALVRRGP